MSVSIIYLWKNPFLAWALSKLAAPAQVLNRRSGRSILKMCTLSNGYGYTILIQTYKYWKGWQ